MFSQTPVPISAPPVSSDPRRHTIDLGLARRTFLRLSVFFFIFGPIVNIGLGGFGDTLSLACVIWMAIALYRFDSSLRDMRPSVRALTAVLVLCVGYGVLSSLILGVGEVPLQIALRPLRALIMFTGIYLFVKYYAASFRHEFEAALLYDIFFAVSLHALIMVLEFVIPALRDIIYPYTFADQVDPYNQMFRMAGLTNGGGAQLSLFQAVGVLLWPLVSMRERRGTWHVVNLIFLFANIASLVLSGRSGILLVAMMFPVVLAYCVIKNRNVAFRKVLAPLLTAVVLLFAALSVLLTSIGVSEDNESGAYLQAAFDRSMEFFSDEPISENAGVQALDQMFFLPDSPSVLVFGDPNLFEASYNMEDRIVKSDVGYVIMLFGYGLLGSSIQYLFYFLILLYSFRMRRRAPALAFMSVIWTISLFIAHAKEVLFFSRIGFSITVMFFVGLALHERTANVNMLHRYDVTGRADAR